MHGHSENDAFPAAERRDDPAVGVIATPSNADAVARVVLRARRRGHAAFVTYFDNPAIESVAFARELGAEVVRPDASAGTADSLYGALATAARVRGFPGLLYLEDTSRYVDYEASVESFAAHDGYAVPARTTDTTATATAAQTLVAIPASNEAETIGEVVRVARDHADRVLVVDDGSEDDTAARAEAAGATVYRHDYNRGYGAALKTAFREACRWGVDHLVTLDGDGQHDPADVPRLVETLEREDADLVIGSRFVGTGATEMPLYRRIGVRVINVLTKASVGIVRADSWVRDTQSGYRAYGPRAIRTIADDVTLGNGWSASTDILYHVHERGFDVAEVHTTIDYTVDHANNHNPVGQGLSLVGNILKTVEQKHPIAIIGLPGFATAVVGLGGSYWTLSTFIQTGAFAVPTAIASAFLVLAGILACCTAIILHHLTTYLAPWTERR